MGRISIVSAMMIIATLVASGLPAEAKSKDGDPMLGFSLAGRSSDALIDGPLLRQAKAAFAAANSADANGLESFLAPGSKLTLSWFEEGELKESPFTAAVIRAASESCVGPWAFDEGSSWVQLSWICSTDADMPLSRFLKFERSPELSLTVWFEGDRIKQVDAMEPIPWPGAHRYRMGAFCDMVAQGTPFAHPSRCLDR